MIWDRLGENPEQACMYCILFNSQNIREGSNIF